MEIKIVLEKDVEIVLSIEEAKQLYTELGKLFSEKPLLQYPPGVRDTRYRTELHGGAS